MVMTLSFIWYLVVAGPNGGLVVMPSGFDTREDCEAALTEFVSKPTPGWSAQCVPGGVAFDESEPPQIK